MFFINAVVRHELLTFYILLCAVKSFNMSWKKIETAPKDGTCVLVCDENYYYPETASFRTYHPNAQGKKTWRTKSMGTKVNPTHWMPLPAKP